MTSDDEILQAIHAGDLRQTLPRVAYDGPLYETGERPVLVFDCPVPDPGAHTYNFGVLFLVVDKPAADDVAVFPAALTIDDEIVSGRPVGPLIGISDTSVADALADARSAAAGR